MFSVQVVVLTIGRRVVGLTNGQLCSVYRYAPFTIVEDDFNSVHVIFSLGLGATFTLASLLDMKSLSNFVEFLTWRKVRFSCLVFSLQESLSANIIATIGEFIFVLNTYLKGN